VLSQYMPAKARHHTPKAEQFLFVPALAQVLVVL
jgi:hypothetical protein